MRCMHCAHPTHVLETRQHEGEVYRRRRCPDCKKAFVTRETPVPKFPTELVERNLARIKPKGATR